MQKRDRCTHSIDELYKMTPLFVAILSEQEEPLYLSAIDSSLCIPSVSLEFQDEEGV